MAITVSLTGDWLQNTGNRRQVQGTLHFDNSYTTGGEALTAANIGLGVIEYIDFNNAGGYTFAYDYTNKKVQAYAAGGSTVPTVTIVGSQAAGPALQISPDSASGVLGKASAGTVTIPGATFGLSASGAAGGEVASTTDLSATIIHFSAVGR